MVKAIAIAIQEAVVLKPAGGFERYAEWAGPHPEQARRKSDNSNEDNHLPGIGDHHQTRAVLRKVQ